MRTVEKVCFNDFVDDRGSLLALEAGREVPFEIKRVYMIGGGFESKARGFHAHHNLSQILVCLNGSCSVIVDDGFTREEVFLSDRTQGLHISGLIWREIHGLTEKDVLVVLASEFFEEADYVRDYELFLHLSKKMERGI